MKMALVNPRWDFSGSIYFGCREPHLPLEFGYAAGLLRQAGHEVRILDGHLLDRANTALADDVAAFAPDWTIVATAPSYLFWRCPPPELRVPAEFLQALDGRGGRTAAVGPHGSTTPGAALRKLGTDLVIRGECEAAIAALAETPQPQEIAGAAWLEDGILHSNGGPQIVADFAELAPLEWPQEWIQRHRHHHHRFDRQPDGPGAEVEASRGCPYSCSFCAKLDFRDGYRRRQLPRLLTEIDRLVGQGVTYLYFIDEIFLPQPALLEALAQRGVSFGVQTRIDLWKPAMLELLGQAGCVSIEAGVESLSAAGRAALDKNCRMDNDALAERLIEARRRVPFVQANLIGCEEDDPAEIARWRRRLQAEGVWANDPVPLYPYPASPDYRKLWGLPDDSAWERAHDHYLQVFDRFSDIQDTRPLPLRELEAPCGR